MKEYEIELMSIKNIALATGISVSWIRQLIKNTTKKLKTKKIKNANHYDIKEIVSIIEMTEKKPSRKQVLIGEVFKFDGELAHVFGSTFDCIILKPVRKGVKLNRAKNVLYCDIGEFTALVNNGRLVKHSGELV